MLVDLNKKSWQWAVLIFLAFVWGTSFIMMKRGLETFSSLQVGCMRIFFSFIFFIPFLFRHFKLINRSNLKSILIVGFVGTAMPALLFATAQTHLSSSVTGILNSLTPIFTMLVGITLYSNRVKLLSIGGLVIGLIGAGGLVLSVNGFDLGSSIHIYSIFAILGTLCYGINVNEIKFRLYNMDSVAIASLGFLFIGPLAGMILIFTDLSGPLQSPGFSDSLIAIIALSFFSSFVALIIMNILIKHTTTLFSASVTYIIPIFAVLWGILDGEPFLPVHALWSAVILLGVYLVNLKRAK